MSRSGPSTFASKGKRWTGTVDGDRGNRSIDVETARLLKTQDMGYLRTQRTLALKEVKALEERVVGLGGSLDPSTITADAGRDDEDDEMDGLDDEITPVTGKTAKPKKIVFMDGVFEREEMIFNLEVDKDEGDGEDDDPEDGKEKSPEKLRAHQRLRLLEKLQRRLQSARKKLNVLAGAENRLEIQRASMAKTATVGGVRKSGKRIKIRERKR